MNKKSKKSKKSRKKNNKDKSNKKIAKLRNNLDSPNIISTKKLQAMLIICFILLILLVARLFYLQIVEGSYLSNLASIQQTTSEEISSKRGNIYDSTGASLAISETVDTISVNPSSIKGDTEEETTELKETVALGLSEIFELDYNETLEKLNSSSSSVTIAKKVEEDKVAELELWMEENNITTGINIDEDTKRYYPYGTLASQIIGAVRNR